MTAGLTGLRFGELAALKVSNLDLLRRRLTVTETASEVGGRVTIGEPKTRASRRTVALPAALREVLAEHLATHPPGAEGLVFTAPEGGPIRRTNFRRRHWLPAVAEAGLEPLRFHDLRHTHVALLIEQGVHPKAIASRLGHTSVRVVLDRY